MLAFHGKPATKAKYLDRVRAHRAADQIVQGVYWQGGKGCAIGCAIHGDDHEKYERLLGIPEPLARLQDRIFEGLPVAVAVDFPARFLEAIPVGADLSLVTGRFLHWLLTAPEVDLAGKADDAGRAAIARVAALWERRLGGDDPTEDEWDAAAGVAGHAARAAGDAARAAEAAAGYAAGAAGYAAGYAWSAAWAAAGDATWQAMADRLVALLAEAPVPA